jgi:hypothetical protein
MRTSNLAAVLPLYGSSCVPVPGNPSVRTAIQTLRTNAGRGVGVGVGVGVGIGVGVGVGADVVVTLNVFAKGELPPEL